MWQKLNVNVDFFHTTEKREYGLYGCIFIFSQGKRTVFVEALHWAKKMSLFLWWMVIASCFLGSSISYFIYYILLFLSIVWMWIHTMWAWAFICLCWMCVLYFFEPCLVAAKISKWNTEFFLGEALQNQKLGICQNLGLHVFICVCLCVRLFLCTLACACQITVLYQCSHVLRDLWYASHGWDSLRLQSGWK